MTAPESPLALECQAIHHWFGSKKVLFDVNLKIIRGQFVGLVGPSGCGKSTLLRAIVGTHLPLKGEVFTFNADGRSQRVGGPGRDRGIVYQHYSLFPFLTAQENVAIGLMLDETSIPFRLLQFPKWRKMRKQHLEMAAAFLDKVKLSGANNLYPHEMSGGMKQRVAIAQAMIMRPEIILLDEPFGALDEATREELQRMLLALAAENKEAAKRGQKPPYTLIIVTHELNEALFVSDRVVGLSQYWDWTAENHATCPGATIIYDKATPAIKPTSADEFELFAEERQDIRDVVFEPKILQNRHQNVRYWKESAKTAG